MRILARCERIPRIVTIIRAFTVLTMFCVIALVSGAPAWVVYVGACAAVSVVLIKEPKK